MFGRLIVAVLRWRNKRRHRRCLANIARLELAMGMVPEPTKTQWIEDEFKMEPGARWLVTDPGRVTLYDEYGVITYDPDCALCRSGCAKPHRPVRTANYPQVMAYKYELTRRGLMSSAERRRLEAEH